MACRTVFQSVAAILALAMLLSSCSGVPYVPFVSAPDNGDVKVAAVDQNIQQLP